MTTHPEYCPFVVGDRVVCVDDGAPEMSANEIADMDGLTRGCVYTIRWVGLDEGDICVRLVEIVRGVCETTKVPDVPYLASRFRPAPSISVFTELLNKAPTPEVVG